MVQVTGCNVSQIKYQLLGQKSSGTTEIMAADNKKLTSILA
jgi:hypothetical protein